MPRYAKGSPITFRDAEGVLRECVIDRVWPQGGREALIKVRDAQRPHGVLSVCHILHVNDMETAHAQA